MFGLISPKKFPRARLIQSSRSPMTRAMVQSPRQPKAGLQPARIIAGVLVLLSLLAGGFVPAGFMPGTVAGKPAIVICDGVSHAHDLTGGGHGTDGMAGMGDMRGMVDMPGMTMASGGSDHAVPAGKPAHPSSDSHHPCPFAAAATFSTTPNPVVPASPYQAMVLHAGTPVLFSLATIHRPYFSQGPPSPAQA